LATPKEPCTVSSEVIPFSDTGTSFLFRGLTRAGRVLTCLTLINAWPTQPTRVSTNSTKGPMNKMLLFIISENGHDKHSLYVTPSLQKHCWTKL
jgi:hypothetical protein